MCESLGQQRQRVGHKVELVRGDALAAVGGDGQGVPLSVDAEELQVEEAGSEPALQGATQVTGYGAAWSNRDCGGGGRMGGWVGGWWTHSLQDGFAVAPRQHLQGRQGLLRHVDELDHLKLQTRGGRLALEQENSTERIYLEHVQQT